MTHSDNYGDDPPQGRRRSRGRAATAVVAGLAVTVGLGYWGYTSLVADEKDSGDPEVEAAAGQFDTFLGAWEKGDAPTAAGLTDTPDNAESLIKSVMTNLKPTKTEITAKTGEKNPEGEVEIPFTVRMTLPGAGEYAWDSTAKVVGGGKEWKVAFNTEMIHPQMVPGQTLALKSRERADILDANGNVLQAASIIGAVDPRTGKGSAGLQSRYDKQLTGGSGAARSVVILDRESGQVVKKLTGLKDTEGKPVKTTIDPRVQSAAAAALEGSKKNAAIVAVDPATGNILAAANVPSGMNRALEGRYPPGSTFKVVTTAALLQQGMNPEERADCPKFAHVNGQSFENQDQFTLPAGSTFRDSFAHSCNTFFVNSRSKLSESSLKQAAEAFGIGGTWDVGASTFDGSVPVSNSENDKAASTIGQARVEASPLVMASIAATVKQGEFKQPVLVPDAVKKPHQAPRMAPGIVDSLRSMMRSTVTDGAGDALRGLGGQPHAKTGTAEFGTEKPPKTHAWMIGYQGDRNIAWPVPLRSGRS